ncbi:hypothetical protein [Mesobacillus foraminis]|uniref:Uncharacterized protein n=1 Tax=Mesobacillus foraminis TaxID=279826 RepID=A0A4R2B1R7_9BACI|nr:hypothetical protein [Mesobacillus foraminis]TCN20458.1 hypothetical protein EV146_11477 [Mesobacillus foraminis]
MKKIKNRGSFDVTLEGERQAINQLTLISFARQYKKEDAQWRKINKQSIH